MSWPLGAEVVVRSRPDGVIGYCFPAVVVSDKPWLSTSASGTDVYITWTTRGNVYAVNSHNAGASFTAPLQVTNESAIYYYSNGGTVLPNGTALMVGSEYPESENNTKNTGPVPIVVFRTTNVVDPHGRRYVEHRRDVRDLIGDDGRLGRERQRGAGLQRIALGGR
jgi:hypothetical protein